MIHVSCDQCDATISLADGGWFGADHVRPGDDGQLSEVGVDHEFHFCSADCMASWAMHRAFSPAPEVHP